MLRAMRRHLIQSEVRSGQVRSGQVRRGEVRSGQGLAQPRQIQGREASRVERATSRPLPAPACIRAQAHAVVGGEHGCRGERALGPTGGARGRAAWRRGARPRASAAPLGLADGAQAGCLQVATHCSRHKLEGQVDLKNRRYLCRHPAGCLRLASFGHVLHGRPLFCARHKALQVASRNDPGPCHLAALERLAAHRHVACAIIGAPMGRPLLSCARVGCSTSTSGEPSAREAAAIATARR